MQQLVLIATWKRCVSLKKCDKANTLSLHLCNAWIEIYKEIEERDKKYFGFDMAVEVAAICIDTGLSTI